MINYAEFKSLLNDWQHLPVPGRIYIEVVKFNDIETARYWTVSSKEAKEQYMVETDHGRVPESLKNFNAKSFLDTQLFQDIIEHELDRIAGLTIIQSDVLVNAVKYYLEYDDFIG